MFLFGLVLWRQDAAPRHAEDVVLGLEAAQAELADALGEPCEGVVARGRSKELRLVVFGHAVVVLDLHGEHAVVGQNVHGVVESAERAHDLLGLLLQVVELDACTGVAAPERGAGVVEFDLDVVGLDDLSVFVADRGLESRVEVGVFRLGDDEGDRAQILLFDRVAHALLNPVLPTRKDASERVARARTRARDNEEDLRTRAASVFHAYLEGGGLFNRHHFFLREWPEIARFGCFEACDCAELDGQAETI